MPAPDHDRALGDELDLIATVAREGGEIAMRYFRGNPQVWMKHGQSPVSEADLAVDRHLRERLLAARPGYGWLSEETADAPERLTRQRTFVVDPIDGTRAFIDGSQHWCVSVAVVEAGATIAGVLDAPARGEIWQARRGSGATLNGRAIRTATSAPGRVLRVSGPKALIDHAELRTSLLFERSRYIPSLALRLAFVAGGEIDATLVKAHSHDWDLAAADLILSESGGSIVDARGHRPSYAGRDPRHGELVAAAAGLVAALLPAISRESAP